MGSILKQTFATFKALCLRAFRRCCKTHPLWNTGRGQCCPLKSDGVCSRDDAESLALLESFDAAINVAFGAASNQAELPRRID